MTASSKWDTPSVTTRKPHVAARDIAGGSKFVREATSLRPAPADINKKNTTTIKGEHN